MAYDSNRHNTGQVANWILTNAKGVQSNRDDEFQFPCPKCGHKNHYFNVRKGIGFCHRASCKHVSTIIKLAHGWGTRPEDTVVGYISTNKPPPDPAQEVLCFPSDTSNLVFREQGRLVTRYPEVVEGIKRSRFISAEDCFKRAIQFCPETERIIVPVYAEGTLVNYVSRSVWWRPSATDYKRYDYPRGHNIKKWLYDWAEASAWTEVTLVENTFNAIWLWSSLFCTTCFGSDLSKDQIRHIYYSKVQRVTFMWDQGAEVRAQKAQRKLKKQGIDSRLVQFTEDRPQPDNWTVEELKQMKAEAWEQPEV